MVVKSIALWGYGDNVAVGGIAIIGGVWDPIWIIAVAGYSGDMDAFETGFDVQVQGSCGRKRSFTPRVVKRYGYSRICHCQLEV